MKKILLALIVVLFSLFVCAAANDVYSFPISGIVRSDLVFSVSIFEDALPFDLDSTLVNYNASNQTFATGIVSSLESSNSEPAELRSRIVIDNSGRLPVFSFLYAEIILVVPRSVTSVYVSPSANMQK